MRHASALCLAAAITCGTLPACSNPPTLSGDGRYPALPEGSPVEVFTNAADIGRPYKVLGVISAYDLGKYRVLGVQDAFPALEEKARAIGGNGVIIDSYQPVKSGIMSTGYSVYGRAVRIGR